MNEFFVVVPPGWEEDLAAELREIEGFLIGADGLASPRGLGEIKIEAGGVTLKADPTLALQLHFFSKLASRILLRVGKFHATEFPMLEKSLRKIDLKMWIGEIDFRLKIEAQKSKLNNEKRIQQTAERVWGKRINSDAPQTILIRADHDQFLVSLDLSGEHLHRRRSGRELGGPAPIRETLAAALLRFLIANEPLSVLREIELVDPMAGSGTLLTEASQLYRPLKTREFAFQSQAWIPKILKSDAFFSNYRVVPDRTWRALIACDLAAPARERLGALGQTLPEKIEVFANARELPKGAKRWVIANPPYGERLKALDSQDLAETLLAADPERAALILPRALADSLIRVWPKGWGLEKKSVSNGGIPCSFLRFEKKF